MGIKRNIRHFLSTMILIVTMTLLTACGETDEKTKASNHVVSDQGQAKTKTSEPAIGALISDLKSIVNDDDDDYRELDWKELAPESDAEKKLIAKYQPQIDKIPEGSDATPLYDKMIAEFNALPANPKLDGQKIKLPGYVTVLEQNKGLVSEFLLVPYYGACIHVPPPPLNNTLLIKLKKNQRLHMDDIYLPVWVKGIIHTKNTKTDLATAGYLIENAEVKLFENEE